MTLKTIKYNYAEIKKTISKKGKRSEDDPCKTLSKDLQDNNVVYLFYKNDECLYVGETNTSLWARIIKHTPHERKEKWFKESNTIHLIILDPQIDDYSRRNIESCFIINLLRAGHKLMNKK